MSSVEAFFLCSEYPGKVNVCLYVTFLYTQYIRFGMVIKYELFKLSPLFFMCERSSIVCLLYVDNLDYLSEDNRWHRSDRRK